MKEAREVCSKGHKISEVGLNSRGYCKQCYRKYHIAGTLKYRQKNPEKVLGLGQGSLTPTAPGLDEGTIRNSTANKVGLVSFVVRLKLT